MKKNQKKGKTVAGGSTISQQLAKNLFPDAGTLALAQGEEAIITLMIESVWSKQRIFEVYLNVIEWGNGVFGAEAAARHYYNISAAQLGAEQAARLAGMVPSPRFYDRNRSAPGLARKTEVILARMPSAAGLENAIPFCRIPCNCCAAANVVHSAASHFRSYSRGQLPV